MSRSNFLELRFGEVRVLGFLRSSLSAYRASTGPGYPSGCPGPSVANIPRRGGRPAEVRHVPDNKGVSCRGLDYVALGALSAAALLRSRTGHSGSGLYTVLGRADSFFSPSRLARPSLCPVVRCAGPWMMRP